MAKGTAGKSASGASMSKYDIEVEARLQALEKAIEECKATCAANSHSHDGGGSDPRVDTIIKVLQAAPKINYDRQAARIEGSPLPQRESAMMSATDLV